MGKKKLAKKKNVANKKDSRRQEAVLQRRTKCPDGLSIWIN